MFALPTMREDKQIQTRHTLLNRLKNRDDQTSWRDFYGLYRPLILNVAAKSGLTDTEAQDVFQDTMVAVARKIDAFEVDPSRGSFSAWLMRLVRWRISDQFRKRGKLGSAPACSAAPRDDESALTATVHRLADPAGSPFDKAWSDEWERALTTAALERVKLEVSSKQYQIFDLHVLQNLSVAETTQTLHVSTASVYVAKYRVSKLLQKHIQELQAAR